MQAKRLTPAGVALTSTTGKLVATFETTADRALIEDMRPTSYLCTQALIDSSTLPDGSLDSKAKYVEVDGVLCTPEEAAIEAQRRKVLLEAIDEELALADAFIEAFVEELLAMSDEAVTAGKDEAAILAEAQAMLEAAATEAARRLAAADKTD